MYTILSLFSLEVLQLRAEAPEVQEACCELKFLHKSLLRVISSFRIDIQAR